MLFQSGPFLLKFTLFLLVGHGFNLGRIVFLRHVNAFAHFKANHVPTRKHPRQWLRQCVHYIYIACIAYVTLNFFKLNFLAYWFKAARTEDCCSTANLQWIRIKDFFVAKKRFNFLNLLKNILTVVHKEQIFSQLNQL